MTPLASLGIAEQAVPELLLELRHMRKSMPIGLRAGVMFFPAKLG